MTALVQAFERPLRAALRRAAQARGRHRYAAAAVAALVVGIACATVLTTFAATIAHFYPIAQWGDSAASNLNSAGPISTFLLAVLFAPLVETAMGQTIPIELARRLKVPQVYWAPLGGAVFGLGHFINGGIMHGAMTFLGGLLFSLAYVALRPAGPGPAYVAACGAHAVHNSLLIYVMAAIFPSLA